MSGPKFTPGQEQAIQRVQHYVDMRLKQPLSQIGNSIHAIHTSTEWEAELLLSDLILVCAALARARGETP